MRYVGYHVAQRTVGQESAKMQLSENLAVPNSRIRVRGPTSIGANLVFTAISVSYVALLSWIYNIEISVHWGYMYFYGFMTGTKTTLAALISIPFSLMASKDMSTRSVLVIAAHFTFFMPYIVYLVAIGGGAVPWLCLLILALSVYLISGIRISVPVFASVPPLRATYFLGILVLFFIGLYILFGGLSTFSLDIYSVYEYRSDAASNLPSIFAYIFSNLSYTLIPLFALLSAVTKRPSLMVAAVFCGILLFGMTHHKSVLFGPIFALMLFFLLRWRPNPTVLAGALASIAVIPLLEISYTNLVRTTPEPSVFSELMIRRTLLVPAMLDTLHIELFKDLDYFWWRNSRVGSLLGTEASSLSVPYMVGLLFFGNSETAANAGVIGSGFSNAGILGVMLYSVASGLFVALLNGYGDRLGHLFVSSGSIMIFFTLLSGSDLLTMLFSNGIILLIVFLGSIRHKTLARRPD